MRRVRASGAERGSELVRAAAPCAARAAVRACVHEPRVGSLKAGCASRRRGVQQGWAVRGVAERSGRAPCVCARGQAERGARAGVEGAAGRSRRRPGRAGRRGGTQAGEQGPGRAGACGQGACSGRDCGSEAEEGEGERKERGREKKKEKEEKEMEKGKKN